ncbi:MAG TPA: aspartyl/asparaginyl beta-hydroxylase domain-containing protein [Caulobacteraceae bacterium]
MAPRPRQPEAVLAVGELARLSGGFENQGRMTSPQEYERLAREGADALRRLDMAAARCAFEALLAFKPRDERALHGLALACRAQADSEAQLAALNALLGVNPGHIPALMMKGDHFARLGDDRAAHAFYAAAAARPAQAVTAELRSEVARAEREGARFAKSYEDHLLNALANAGYDHDRSSPRFKRCLDLLFGRSQIFLQSPTAFYFPELPQRQFYERDEFPWLAEIEEATDAIRGELETLLAGDDRAFSPYVATEGARPPRDYGRLLDSRDWSAFYLIRGGEIQEQAAKRCPLTLKALKAAPLCHAHGRTPSVLFSLLRPHTHIPPHTGYTNARLICHLPLIVPDGCRLRVGSETRMWTPGEALIFDDSLEHEAWNDSDQRRVVLLFDNWRPELSDDERDLVAATLAAVGSYGGQAAWT